MRNVFWGQTPWLVLLCLSGAAAQTCATWGAWSAGSWRCNGQYRTHGLYFEELAISRTCLTASLPPDTLVTDSVAASDSGVCNSGCSGWSNTGNYYVAGVCSEQSSGVFKELEKEAYNQTRSGNPCYTSFKQVETGNSRWGADCWSEWSSCSQTCGSGTRTRYFSTSGTNPTSEACKVIDCVIFPTGCDAQLDVGFIVDSSGSITAANFPLVKEFIVTLVEAMRTGIDTGRTKVSMVRYSNTFSITQIFDFKDHSTTNDVIDGVYKMAFTGGGTYTGLAMNYMLDNSFTTANGYRPSVPDIVFVITDGRSYDGLNGPAQRLHDRNVTVYAIGVSSGVVKAQLDIIASDPDVSHVFLASTFTDLSSITSNVMSTVCTAATSGTTSPTTSTTTSTTTSPTTSTTTSATTSTTTSATTSTTTSTTTSPTTSTTTSTTTSPTTSITTSTTTSPTTSTTTSPTTSITTSTTTSPTTSTTTSPTTSITTSTTTSPTTSTTTPPTTSSTTSPTTSGAASSTTEETPSDPAPLPMALIAGPAGLLITAAAVITGCCCAKGMAGRKRGSSGNDDKDDLNLSGLSIGSNGSTNKVAPFATAPALRFAYQSAPPGDTKINFRPE